VAIELVVGGFFGAVRGNAEEVMSALIDPVDPDLYYIPKVRPVVRWVGGKSQLKDVILKEIDRLYPERIETYYEPFAGGLAVFFALVAAGRIDRAVLSDSNAELMGFYLQIQKQPKALIAALKKLKKKGFGEKRYYEVRDWKPHGDADQAARFKYLNACDFNGLYRVNRQNVFNVPYGHAKKPPEICDEEAIWAAHYALQCAVLYTSDFIGICHDIRATCAQKSFVYLDSPYWPTKPTSDFTTYTPGGFKAKDQEALAYQMKEFARLGIPALLSNSDVPATRKLYAAFKKKKVSARRNVNSVGTGRGAVSELLVESTFRK
jgi:DNA adenine methylase